MLRTSLLSLAALSFAAFGATSAGASPYGAAGAAGGYENDNIQNVGYYHCHRKKKRIKVIVGYDYYNNPIYKYRIKWVKYCHDYNHGY